MGVSLKKELRPVNLFVWDERNKTILILVVLTLKSSLLFFTITAVVRDVNNQDEKQDPFYEVKGIITLEGKSDQNRN